MSSCFLNPCGSIHSTQHAVTRYLVPTKIDEENKEIGLIAISPERGIDPHIQVISLKQARKYQKGKFDTRDTEYKLAGIKINKNGDIKFNNKYKEEVKSCHKGPKTWKKFKELKEEFKPQEEENDLEL